MTPTATATATEHPLAWTTRRLASGTVVAIDEAGRALPLEALGEEGPTCSICDGLGHGYPGAGPCPLEERGAYDFDGAWR